jgi:hypothetical protein
VDVAHKWGAEAVDEELDRLIEKRSSRDVDPDERGETWKESVRRYNARQQEENRQAWCEYHQGQADRLRGLVGPLIAFHEEKARKLLADEDRGEGRT